jgi:hypothetical protein
MYHEFAGDPAVQCLDFGDQRHYVMVLCFKASGFLDREMPSGDFRHRAICKALGLDPLAGGEARRRLQEVGLVDADWQPLGWDKRQYKSDNSTARVKKFRAKSEEEETKKETDTDTEGNVTCNVSETFQASDATVTSHESLPAETWQEWLSHRKRRRWPCDPTTLKKQLTLLAKFDTPTQREMLDTSMQAGWQGLFPPKGAPKQVRKFTRPKTADELEQEASRAAR